jgi:hypothetical protein
MDMKRILQALDSTATKPVAGTKDMARFLRLVSEADINQSTPQYGDPKEQASEYIRFSSGLYNKSILPPTMSFGPGIAPLPITFTPLAQGVDTSKTVQANINAANARLPKELQKSPEEMSQIVGGADKPYQGPSINDPYTGPKAESINKFLDIINKNNVSILNEGSNPHKVSLPVQMAMQHYQKPQAVEPVHKPVGRALTIGKYFHQVEEEVAEEQDNKKQMMRQYASVIAERVMMKEGKKDRIEQAAKQRAVKDLDLDHKTYQNSFGHHGLELDERSVSQAQARTMAAAAHNPEFAKKVGIKQNVAKEFNKADTGKKLNTLPKRVKKGKPVNENEIPDHTIGFTPGPGGPGLQSNVPDSGHLGLGEAPLDFDKENPTASTIYGHKSNPGSIEYRIMRARAQLKELAQQADSNELIVWESIARHFPELAMNIEEIRHGIEELAKIRKGGGRRVHNIPKDIGESNPIKEANAKKKTLKNSNPCWTGYKPVGTKKKGGRTVPNCVPTKK